MEEEAGLEAVAAEPKAAPCKNLRYFISHYLDWLFVFWMYFFNSCLLPPIATF